MSDKHLTELPWKTLAIKKQVKDGELTKALVALSKVSENDAAERLKSLDKILTSAETVKRNNKDEKEVVAYLDEVVKEARKAKTLAAAAAAKTNPQAPTDAEADTPAEESDEDAIDAEAEEYKKNYKSKLTGALAQVRSRAPQPGDDAKPQLKFVAMVSGKGSSVLVASNVGGSARKVLKSLAGGGSGAFVAGQCIFEKNAHTFIVQTVPGGLASKLSKALHAQTGMAYKVRVRTPDGSVVLDDETDVDPDAATASGATTTQTEEDGPWEGEAYEDYLDRRRYEGMHESLSEHLAVALQERLGDTGKMRAVIAFAEEKSAEGNFKSAVKALEALEKLVEAAAESSHTAGEASGDGFSKVAFEKIHLDWDSNKKAVETQLEALRQAIIADFEDPESLAATSNLQKVLARFNEGLGDTIDALRDSAEVTQRSQLATKAVGIADHYLDYLGGDPLVAHIEQNPFDINVAVRDTLSAPLHAVKAELAKLSA